MSLIIQTPPEIQQLKTSRFRSEILRLSLAAGALMLSLMLVAPVMSFKPTVKSTMKRASSTAPRSVSVMKSMSFEEFESVSPEARPAEPAKPVAAAKNKPHYFAIEFHHTL
jgi:hypothetical protein